MSAENFNARSTILSALRGTKTHDTTHRSRPQCDIRPPLTGDLLTRFRDKFESRAGTTVTVAHWHDIPAAVTDYCEQQHLPRQALMGQTLQALPWGAEWRFCYGAAQPQDHLSITPSLAGIAESGTLMLGSAAGSPTTHNFVPDDHVVVLSAARIVKYMEDAWTLIRVLPNGVPRAVNFISGPSRTADIEQTLQLGAHGPRRVHVIIVTEALPSPHRADTLSATNKP